MKVVIDIDLDDLLEEVEDDESGNTYYEVKEDNLLKNDIRSKIKDTIISNLHFDSYRGISLGIENLIKECKEEIIEKVVNNVSKKIIQSKAIKDFKKQLEECNDNDNNS